MIVWVGITKVSFSNIHIYIINYSPFENAFAKRNRFTDFIHFPHFLFKEAVYRNSLYFTISSVRKKFFQFSGHVSSESIFSEQFSFLLLYSLENIDRVVFSRSSKFEGVLRWLSFACIAVALPLQSISIPCLLTKLC